MRPAPPSYAAVNAALCIDPINWPLFPAHAALASPHLDRATVSSVRPRPHRQVDTSDFDAGGRRRLKHRYSLSRSSPSIIYPGPSQWHLPEVRALGCDSSWSPHATRQDRWVIRWTGGLRGPACRSPHGATSGSSAALCCSGYLIGLLCPSTQPTRYEGLVRIFVTAEEGTAGGGS